MKMIALRWLVAVPFVILILSLPSFFVYGVPSRSTKSSIHSDNPALEDDYNKVEQERLRLLIDAMQLTKNEQANPCEDYFQYAASGIKKSLNLYPDVFNNQYKEMYERYIKTNNNLSAAECKLKNFFENCENSSQKTSEEFIASLDFKQFGHFPLKEHEWNEDQFDWVTTQAKIQLFPEGGFFQINVKYINGKRQFSIKPAPRKEHRFAVGDKYFDELFKEHGYSINETTALKDIFKEFENELILAYESYSELNTTIGQINENLPVVNLKNFFRIYTNGIAKDNDEVFITGIDALRSYIDILSSKIKKHDLANYLFYDIYETIMKGFNSMTKDRMVCYIIISFNFDDVFANIILNHYLNQNDAMNIIDSSESVLKVFQNDPKKIEEFHLEELVEVLRHRTTHGPKLDDAYKDLNLTNDFISNLAEITRHRQELTQPISPLTPEVCGKLFKFAYNFRDKPRVFIFPILAKNIIWEIPKPYPDTDICLDKHRFNYTFKALEAMKTINEDKFETEEEYLKKSNSNHIKVFFTIFSQYYDVDYYYDTSHLQTAFISLKKFTDAYGCPEDKVKFVKCLQNDYE